MVVFSVVQGRAGQGRVLEGQGLPKLKPEPQALPCLMPEAWPEGTLVQRFKLLKLSVQEQKWYLLR